MKVKKGNIGMRMEVDLIKDGLKSLLRSLWDFIKKVFVFCFFYGRLCIFPALLGIGLMFLLKISGVPVDICTIVMKLTFIIGQIIPAAGYAGMINADQNVEGSMDICFSGWIIFSILIWYNF